MECRAVNLGNNWRETEIRTFPKRNPARKRKPRAQSEIPTLSKSQHPPDLVVSIFVKLLVTNILRIKIAGLQLSVHCVRNPPMTLEEQIEAAWRVREAAYAPYSRFYVGAALLSDGGELFTGANVENLSFGLTICAERAAVCAAISAGSRKFSRLVVVADTQNPVSPCGACRQFLAEFSPELEIISCTKSDNRFESSLAVLLPRASTGILEPRCST